MHRRLLSRPTTAISIPGTRLLFFSERITANVPAPTANAIQLAFPFKIACAIAHSSLNGPSPSIEKPKSLGSWLISTRQRYSVHVAIADRLGKQLGYEAQPS